MKTFVILYALLIMPFAIMANTKTEVPLKYWKAGEAYLKTGEKIKGKIYYEIDKELVLILNKGKIKTYSPNQMEKFSIVDEETGIHRLFYSISISLSGQNKRQYFFEIMMEGHVVLLRKQRTRSDGFGLFLFDESKIPGYGGYFDYYFLYDNQFTKVRRFKRDALAIMHDQKDKVELFIQNNGLQLKKVDDQIRLLKYYNTICEEQTWAKTRP